MSALKHRLGSVAENPTGALGWVGAAVMVVQGPSDCHHKAMAELARLEADDVLLDVACGSALFLRRYARHVRRIAAIDRSALQLRMARRVLRQRLIAGSAEVVRGDAAALPCPDAIFTVVTCNCLSCVVEAERALAEMYRVLQPGGRVVLASDYQPDERSARHHEHEWGLRAWAEPELRAMLVDVGFVEIALTRDPTAMLATARRSR